MADIDYGQLADAMARALRASGNSSGYFNSANPTGDPAYANLERPEYHRNLKRQQAATKSAAEGLKDLSKELKTFKSGELGKRSRILTKLSQHTSDSMIELNKQFKTSADAIHFWQTRTGRSLLNLDKRATSLRETLQKATLTSKERLEAEQDLLEVERQRTQTLHNEFGSGGGWKKAVLAGFTGLAGSILQSVGKSLYNDMRTQMGSAGIGGFGQMVTNALYQAVDPAELSRISKENRAAQIAMSNNGKNVNELFEQTQRNLSTLLMRTKNAAEASELYAVTATSLVQSGIKPSEQAILEQIKASDKLAKISGMTALEFAKLNSALSENVDMRFILQGTMTEERQARRNVYLGMIAYNREQGMLQQQAQRAAEALGAMAAESPLERMKKGARLAAAAGALGIAGGQDIRQMLIRGGPQTEAEARQAADFMAQLSQAQQAARQRGDVAGEMMVNRLLQGLDLQQTLGKGSVFNRALGEFSKVPKETEDKLQLTSESIKQVADEYLKPFGMQFEDAVKRFDQATNIYKDFGVKEGISRLFGSFGGGIAGGAVAGSVLGKMLGLGRGGKGSGGLMRGLVKGGKGVGSLARLAGIPLAVGGSLFTAGTAAYKSMGYWFGDEKQQKQSSQDVGKFVDYMLSSVGLGGVTGADERLGMLEKQSQAIERTAANSDEQTYATKTTNDLLMENNQYQRALLETLGGGEALRRLSDIDVAAQPPGVYGDR